MNNTETLIEAALEVLNTADPVDKARLGDASANRWLLGEISLPFRQDDDLSVPNRPTRPSNVRLVSSSLMPKLGKGGSLRSRQAMLHSLVHTESWAIDLSWDIIARFGRKESMPRDFFTDFVKVAQDEGRHFLLLVRRLEELGSYYGAFPAHDGLWDSASQTSNDLSARLAVEHCVHEVCINSLLYAQISVILHFEDSICRSIVPLIHLLDECKQQALSVIRNGIGCISEYWSMKVCVCPWSRLSGHTVCHSVIDCLPLSKEPSGGSRHIALRWLEAHLGDDDHN